MDLVALLVGILLVAWGLTQWPATLAIVAVVFGAVLLVFGVRGAPWRR